MWIIVLLTINLFCVSLELDLTRTLTMSEERFMNPSNLTTFSRKRDLTSRATVRPSVVESVANKTLQVAERDGFACLVQEERPCRTWFSFYCDQVPNATESFEIPLTAEGLRKMLRELEARATYPAVNNFGRHKNRGRGRGWKIRPTQTARGICIRLIPTWI